MSELIEELKAGEKERSIPDQVMVRSYKALQVMLRDPAISVWLAENDPKALEQAQRAVEAIEAWGAMESHAWSSSRAVEAALPASLAPVLIHRETNPDKYLKDGTITLEIYDLGGGRYRSVKTQATPKGVSLGFPSVSEYTLKDGVIRWVSNNSCVPMDAIEERRLDLTPGYDAEKHGRTREEEINAFLDDYRERMKNHVPDAEEMYEMRAAFGEGETVVNIITGQKHHT